MIKQNRQINFGLTGDQFAHCLALNETPDWVSPTITGQIPILALKEKIQSNLLKKITTKNSVQGCTPGLDDLSSSALPIRSACISVWDAKTDMDLQ